MPPPDIAWQPKSTLAKSKPQRRASPIDAQGGSRAAAKETKNR